MISYESQFFIYLALTIIIEVPILLIMLKLVFGYNISTIRLIVIGTIASLLTLPYLWFVLPAYLHGLSYFIIGESGVVLVEALILIILLNLRIHHAFITSCIMNIASFGIGLIICCY